MQRSICLLVKALFILLAAACPDIGRAQMKDLKPEDYHLWSTLNIGKISDKGNWVSYTLSYENGKDTLFIKDTSGKKTFIIPGGIEGDFTGDSWFVCKNQNNVLHILELESGKITVANDVGQYGVAGKQLFYLQVKENERQLLTMNFDDSVLSIIPNVTEFSFNPKKTRLAFISVSNGKSSVGILTVGDKMTTGTIAVYSISIFSNLVWQENGKSLAFLKEAGTITNLLHYDLGNKKLSEANSEKLTGFPANGTITSSSFVPLTVSADGKRVFCGVMSSKPQKESSGVQIWNAADTDIYPMKKLVNGWKDLPKAGVWWPETGRFEMLTDIRFPYLMVSGDGKYALTYNPNKYEALNSQFAPVDIYVTDIEKGKRTLLLQKQNGDMGGIIVSPTGKYMSYFKDNNWWVYEFATGMHRNLTKTLKGFGNTTYEWPGAIPPYGNAGWTNGDKDLLLYDQYDLWKVSTDGKVAQKITSGSEHNISYRIVEVPLKMNFSGVGNGTVDLSKGLLFKTEGKGDMGYSQWTKARGMKPVVFNDALINQFHKAKASGAFVYMQQDYDNPPALFSKIDGHTEKMLFQSNPQHLKYHSCCPKRMTYHDIKGNPLTGMLIYPAGFDATKKYPMVVKIYENQSASHHVYVNPKKNSSTGFNATDYAVNGYFVFLPDIGYEIGNPGVSAVDCIGAAVKAALKESAIDPERVGLIGHSFGGYETNFIITQTHIFRAAVSGAGTSDLASHYLHANAKSTKPLFWRFESGQFRIGKSLFEDPKGYFRNSPVNFASGVKTPLLQWAGESDPQVEPSQAVEFHLALRRNRKANILLMYPGEEHTIQTQQYQADLSDKIREWFGYYLKGDPMPGWMVPDHFE